MNIRGQTLLEVMAAVGILLAGMFGVYTLLQGSAVAALELRDRVRAGALAAEGLEVVRRVRDTNWITGAPWSAGLVGGGLDGTAVAALDPPTGVWLLDFTPNDITDQAAVFVRYPVGAVVDAGPWVQDVPAVVATAAPMNRLITINPACLPDVIGAVDEELAKPGASCPGGQILVGVEVASRVDWTTRGRPHTVTLTTRLYGWQ